MSMKNFEKCTTGIFDQTFSYNTLRGGFGRSGHNVFLIEADAAESRRIKVILNFFGKRLDLKFTSDGSLELTGKGNAGRILATVMEILKKFLEHSTPDEITFIAPTDSPARARVYEKMLRRYTKGSGYELVGTNTRKRRRSDPGEIWFHISRKDNVF